MFFLFIPKTNISAQYNISFQRTELPLIMYLWLPWGLNYLSSHTHRHTQRSHIPIKGCVSLHVSFQIHAWLWVQYLSSSNTAKDGWVLETRNPHTGRVSFLPSLSCVCVLLINISGFWWSCRCLTQYPFIRNALYLSHLKDGLITLSFKCMSQINMHCERTYLTGSEGLSRKEITLWIPLD